MEYKENWWSYKKKKSSPVFSLISQRTLKRAGFILWQLRACFLQGGKKKKSRGKRDYDKQTSISSYSMSSPIQQLEGFYVLCIQYFWSVAQNNWAVLFRGISFLHQSWTSYFIAKTYLKDLSELAIVISFGYCTVEQVMTPNSKVIFIENILVFARSIFLVFRGLRTNPTFI